MNNNHHDKRRSLRAAPSSTSRLPNNASDGTRNSSTQQFQSSAYPAGILATPSKRPKPHNPYARTPPTITPVRNNPYRTSTPSSRVVNPYLSRTASVCKSSSGSGTKRHLDIVATDGSSDHPFKRLQSSAINLNNEFIDVSTNNNNSDIIIDPNKTYTLYFDGGSRGNPGISGAGMVLYTDTNAKIWSGKQYIGNNKTNNESEYIALLTGLTCAKELGVQRIIVKGDSKLVINQVLGEWNCNKDHLRCLLQQVIDVKQHFAKHFCISHVRREDNKHADMLANEAMDEQVTDLGCCSGNVGIGDMLVTPPLSQEDKEASSNNIHEIRATDNINTSNDTHEEELCSLVFSQSIADGTPVKGNCDGGWMTNLPFLVQFEMERFNLSSGLSISEFGKRLKVVYDAHQGKPAMVREMTALIYQEQRNGTTPYYDDLLIRNAIRGTSVDETDSCLFLFKAKLRKDGIELLQPETADTFTRRIHRKWGSGRFLDLHCDKECTASLSVLKAYFKKHFRNNRLELVGRKYGVLYSKATKQGVVFTLFAESGTGIDLGDEISATQVAARCIPKALNPGLSLTKYMKRMKLSFTTTLPSLVLEPVMLEMIPDITSNSGNTMTDGCGLISREALNEVYSRYSSNLELRGTILGKANTKSATQASCPYSSFQGRIGGIKGMFVVDDRLERIKVQYRPSMLKYQASGIDNDELHNTVEVKQWDVPPPNAFLCQTSIQMLEERGVPREFFLSLAQKEIDELKSLRDDPELLLRKYKASKYLQDSPDMIEDDILMRMLHANIPLDEPVMILKINEFINGELKKYREKSKFPVIESRNLRMLPDHTGLLESNEAFIAVGDESAQYDVERTGSIVAMRFPSYFTSDLRKLTIVSKADLIQRCPERGRFFAGIVAGLVLSTKGEKSEAESMSGGDFDGDIAWCCWNKIIIENIEEVPGNTELCQQPFDPFNERKMEHTQPDFTNLIINYTMQHRHDKMNLGSLVKTLEMMKDSRRFNPEEINDIATKAFIQVDNPYKSQYTKDDKTKYGDLKKPHWSTANAGNTYQSKRILGELYDMLRGEGDKAFNYDEIEAEMNPHIREKIDKAVKKNSEEVERIGKDMLKLLKSFNNELSDVYKIQGTDDEDESNSRRKSIKALDKRYRREIENEYDEDDLPTVFAILYYKTYIESRERICRWGREPYVFAWKVGHDYLTRIIADGEAKKNGMGIAPTVARGNAQLIFGKKKY